MKSRSSVVGICGLHASNNRYNRWRDGSRGTRSVLFVLSAVRPALDTYNFSSIMFPSRRCFCNYSSHSALLSTTTTTTTSRSRPLIISVYRKSDSSHGIYIRRPPPPIRALIQPGDRTSRVRRPTSLHGDRTNRIRPSRSVMSLSFPILPDSLDIPARHLVFLYIFGGMYIGDLGWGPRTRHLVLYYTHPAVPLGWKSCCKQEDRRRIHIHT